MLINGMLVFRNSIGVVVAALLFFHFVSSCCRKLAFLAWVLLTMEVGLGENYPIQWGVDKVAWKIELSGKGGFFTDSVARPHLSHRTC